MVGFAKVVVVRSVCTAVTGAGERASGPSDSHKASARALVASTSIVVTRADLLR